MDLRESKSMLAKLLATENIKVEHGNYETAAFDPKKRVLYLPIFKWMDGDVYDLLVLHEVSHAPILLLMVGIHQVVKRVQVTSHFLMSLKMLVLRKKSSESILVHLRQWFLGIVN